MWPATAAQRQRHQRELSRWDWIFCLQPPNVALPLSLTFREIGDVRLPSTQGRSSFVAAHR